MFEAKVESSVLKDLVTVLMSISDEVKLDCNDAGITVRAVDVAHVAMVDLTLRTESFVEYKTDSKGTSFALDLTKFNEILKLTSPKDIVHITHKDGAGRLTVRFKNLRRYMALLEDTSIAFRDVKIPEINLATTAKIKCEDLTQALKAAEAVSDHAVFRVKNGGMIVSAEGQTDSVEASYSKDRLVGLEGDGNVESSFSLDYLCRATKSVASVASETALDLGTNYPIRMRFFFADSFGEATYLIAPRIE